MAGLHAGRAARGVRGHEDGGGAVIKLKGGSGFAVGLSIREVVESLARDSRRVLPVSSLQQGLYGIRDVCLSVPTVVGCGGVRQQIELALTPKERLAMQQSARVLRETIDQVEARIGKVRASQSSTASPAWQRRPDRRWPIYSAGGVEAVRRTALSWNSHDSKISRLKLARIHADPHGSKDFILADAKDADMALSIGAPGRSPEAHGGELRYRTLAEFRDIIDADRRGRSWWTSCSCPPAPTKC